MKKSSKHQLINVHNESYTAINIQKVQVLVIIWQMKWNIVLPPCTNLIIYADPISIEENVCGWFLYAFAVCVLYVCYMYTVFMLYVYSMYTMCLLYQICGCPMCTICTLCGCLKSTVYVLWVYTVYTTVVHGSLWTLQNCFLHKYDI